MEREEASKGELEAAAVHRKLEELKAQAAAAAEAEAQEALQREQKRKQLKARCRPDSNAPEHTPPHLLLPLTAA